MVRFLSFAFFPLLFLAFSHTVLAQDDFLDPIADQDFFVMKEILEKEFLAEKNTEWEKEQIGLSSRVVTEKNIFFIILEACGDGANSFDSALFKEIENQPVPLVLFADRPWLGAHYAKLKQFKFSAPFSIASHGLECRRLLFEDIPGDTRKAKIAAIYDEVEKAARWLERLTGTMPAYYRSKSGAYNRLGLQIVQILGFQVVEPTRIFRLKSGGLFADEWLEGVQPGEIISLPADRPEDNTAELYLQILTHLTRRRFQGEPLEEYEVETRSA